MILLPSDLYTESEVTKSLRNIKQPLKCGPSTGTFGSGLASSLALCHGHVTQADRAVPGRLKGGRVSPPPHISWYIHIYIYTYICIYVSRSAKNGPFRPYLAGLCDAGSACAYPYFETTESLFVARNIWPRMFRFPFLLPCS